MKKHVPLIGRTWTDSKGRTWTVTARGRPGFYCVESRTDSHFRSGEMQIKAICLLTESQPHKEPTQ